MNDAISRQAVCKIIDDIRDCISVEGYWTILERLNKLPLAITNEEPVLDKIRAEIEDLRFGQPLRKLVVDECLQIIDKYKGESGE